MKSFITTTAIALLAGLFTAATEAHISFRYPCPRRGAYAECPQPDSSDFDLIDYNIRSPVGNHDAIASPIPKWPSSFPGVRPTLVAGQTIPAVMDIGAHHNGGSCQWALSYDNATTWVVFQDFLLNCMVNATNGDPFNLPFTLPASAPSGPAILNLFWNNNEGNRELYSSTADVIIQGTNGGTFSGLSPLIANYGPNTPFIQEQPLANGDYGQALFAARQPVTITVPAVQAQKRHWLSRRLAPVHDN
ncbi:hypothetical protein EMPS_11344 [Entomortierella parvispora]|uniref:Chitin-binding type-4 domain-containing protein n=1 Tax=Entomortierella parvispora TaxID=205924 RepID=A0A9P3M2H6_9FUNG|nr:hypothetical protein EMPS_11344 [Entomortierella parvispora]